jgi:hypothetical protein
VVYAINNKRNSVYQDVKPKIKCTYKPGTAALFDPSDPVVDVLDLIQDNPTWDLENFTDRSGHTSKKGFFTFFDTVVTGVCGRRSWTKSIKISQTIYDCKKVTI